MTELTEFGQYIRIYGVFLTVNALSKKCTTGGDEFPLDGFYSKGDRLDSACKSCKRSKRKATYVVQKSKQTSKRAQDVLGRITKCFDIIYQAEHRGLDGYNYRLTEMIERCQKRATQ